MTKTNRTNYLKLKAVENSSVAVKATFRGVNLSYSYDRKTWVDFSFREIEQETGCFWGEYLSPEITINEGKTLYLRGDNSLSMNNIIQFVMTGKIEAKGSLTSISRTAFYMRMFKDCRALVKAPRLPAMDLAAYCYQSMFEGCWNLPSAPALPAIKLAYACYMCMFKDCRALIKIPKLPATILADDCCWGGLWEIEI